MDGRFVTFTSLQPPLSVTAILGQTQPVPADGYGGWTLITRPKRKALTEWQGISPLRVTVNVILGVTPGATLGLTDAFSTVGGSAVADRESLERMAQPPTVGAEPPLITVVGPAVPHASSYPNGWVIESFDWDSSPIYNQQGILVRQPVTVHLLEYVRDDRLADMTAAQILRLEAQLLSASAARAAGGTSNQPSKQKTYVVRAGDTLTQIAARLLGNAKRWTDIASVNGIRDPKSITPGEVLRLP